MLVILGYFAILIVGFYLLLVRPQGRQMAARRALVAAIQVGDEVVTAGTHVLTPGQKVKPWQAPAASAASAAAQ